jgi:hypothetical protein
MRSQVCSTAQSGSYGVAWSPRLVEKSQKYESEEARSAHAKRPALADLMSDLDGKLRGRLDAQVLTPHPSGDPQKGAL